MWLRKPPSQRKPMIKYKLPDTLTTKQKNIILALLCGIFFVTHLSLCFNDNIWTDEAFTIELLKGSFGEIVQGTARDVHPPLYYLILKPFTLAFGSSLLVMKIISIIPMIITMVEGGFWLNSRYGFREGVLFILFLGGIPVTLEYAVQIRMYSWAICFVTCMSIMALELYNKGNRIIALILGMLGAACALTHYFAFVAALWIYGFLFLALVIKNRKKLPYWAGACICSLVLFMPWFPFMRRQVMGVSQNYWIEEITSKTWKTFLPFLFGLDIPFSENIWALIIMGTLIFVILVPGNIKQVAFPILNLLTVVAVLLTGVIISALVNPIFIIRYLIPTMGLLALFLAISLGSINERCLTLSVIVFLIFSTAANYKVSRYREYEWTHTEATKEFLKSNVGPDDIIAYNYQGYKFIYDYYWDDSEKVLWMDIDLSDCPYENIWLLDTIYMPWPTDDYLKEQGWVREYQGNYGIEHNDFKIWKLHRK